MKKNITFETPPRIEIHVVPTDDIKSNIVLEKNLFDPPILHYPDKRPWKGNNTEKRVWLYKTSDWEIKEGDYVLKDNNCVRKVTSLVEVDPASMGWCTIGATKTWKDLYKKIVATNDIKLESVTQMKESEIRSFVKEFNRKKEYYAILETNKPNEPVKEQNTKDIFTPDFLEEIGFKLVSDDGQYGHAIDKRTNGITVLKWNTKGHSVTYFGEKLAPNVSFGIGKDGGSRTAFDGYVYSQNDVRKLLSLTW